MKYNLDEIEFGEFDSDKIKKELEEIAYFKWLEAGRPEGRDVEFWCEAERDMFGYTANEICDTVYDDFNGSCTWNLT